VPPAAAASEAGGEILLSSRSLSLARTNARPVAQTLRPARAAGSPERDDAAVKADAHVGSRIKALRGELGLTQRDLASPGLSYAYISRIEAGTRTPSLSALIELADRLNTNVKGFKTSVHAAAR
jgi:DNA-binding XRE family transcriptional regulator